jgi:hypothetical protein
MGVGENGSMITTYGYGYFGAGIQYEFALGIPMQEQGNGGRTFDVEDSGRRLTTSRDPLSRIMEQLDRTGRLNARSLAEQIFDSKRTGDESTRKASFIMENPSRSQQVGTKKENTDHEDAKRSGNDSKNKDAEYIEAGFSIPSGGGEWGWKYHYFPAYPPVVVPPADPGTPGSE